MLDPASYLTYVAVVLGLFVIPGPAVLLVLARSVGGGRRVGIATGMGVACGDLLHTAMAAFGLSAILLTSAVAFEVVKYAGVAYLGYLGISALLDKGKLLRVGSAGRISVWAAFRQAILAEVLNPKTALFFLAFLPQFVDTSKGSTLAQLTVLGLTFVVMSALFTSGLAITAGGLSGWVNSHPQIGRWQGKVVGSIYLALGLRLALQQR